MNETYSKNYFEKYAALTLTYILNVAEQEIYHSDRPDLRIPKLHFGIEVTQALTPDEAVTDIKKSLSGALSLNPFDHDEKNFGFVLNKIEYAFKRKLVKSKNYTTYLNNGLYIFSHCHNLPETMLKDYLKQLNLQNCFYQHLFINCVDHVFYYHKTKLLKIPFNQYQLQKMNNLALKYEESQKNGAIE